MILTETTGARLSTGDSLNFSWGGEQTRLDCNCFLSKLDGGNTPFDDKHCYLIWVTMEQFYLQKSGYKVAWQISILLTEQLVTH